jgi:hypothetical protein
MADFIPKSDADFDHFFSQFDTWLGANGATHGVDPADITALDGLLSAWATAYAAHLAAQTAAEAARATKDGARADSTVLIRKLGAIIQADPATTDADRAASGLPIRDTTRTAAPVPTTRPVVVADASQRLQHTLSWRDETTPTSRAKPPGVLGAEIWFAVAPTPPADPAQYQFAALDTATPYLLHLAPADGGKTAHYIARWVNTRNQPGPWSETVSATIGA